jgi:hypothetical protein
MYKRSPILRAALSPSNQSQQPAPSGSEKFDREIARIKLMAKLDQETSDDRYAPGSSFTAVSAPKAPSLSALADELQKVQAVITEMILLFQDYQMSVETRLAKFSADMDERIRHAIQVQSQTHSIGMMIGNEPVGAHSIGNQPSYEQFLGDFARLKQGFRILRQDHDRLTDKVKRINAMNCQSHINSSVALKTISDFINR